MFVKLFHRCTPELVSVNNDYYTEYTDTQKKLHHEMRFYRCSCSKRTFSTDYKNDYSKHNGIEAAKKNWIDTGVVPKNSIHPTQNPHYVKLNDVEQEKLDPVLAYQKTLDDISKSLAVVLNRDFNLESKYPELKKAADEYHRRLDKYRNFENLKKNNA